MPTPLLPSIDYNNELRENALIELTKLSSDIFKMKYEVACIYNVKDNYTSEMDQEIQATANYFNFTNEWRFFYFKSINWHGCKLKYLLLNYLNQPDILYPNDYLFVKVNLNKVFTNKYFIDTIEIRGEMVDNPVGLEARYKVLYNLINNPPLTNLSIHCNICNTSLPLHSFDTAHSSSLHCPHHHHMIYDPVLDMENSNLAVL